MSSSHKIAVQESWNISSQLVLSTVLSNSSRWQSCSCLGYCKSACPQSPEHVICKLRGFSGPSQLFCVCSSRSWSCNMTPAQSYRTGLCRMITFTWDALHSLSFIPVESTPSFQASVSPLSTNQPCQRKAYSNHLSSTKISPSSLKPGYSHHKDELSTDHDYKDQLHHHHSYQN